MGAELGPAFPQPFFLPPRFAADPSVIVPQAAFGVCCKHAMGSARAVLGLELSLSSGHVSPLQQHWHLATRKKLLMSTVKFKSLNCFYLFLN